MDFRVWDRCRLAPARSQFREDQTATDIAVTTARLVAMPVRGPAELGSVVPRATTQNTALILSVEAV